MQRPCIWCQKGKKRKKKKDLALIMFCFFNLAASYMDLLKCVPGGSEVKESASNAGDLGSIPGSGRSPGEGNGNPLQYSCLENPMDGGPWWATVHGVAKSRTRLSDFTFFLSPASGFQSYSYSSLKFSPSVFKDNGLPFWMPDVLCQHSEVVL